MTRLEREFKKRKIDLKHLESTETFEKISKLADEFIHFFEPSLSYDFIRFFQSETQKKDFKNQYPRMYQKYQSIMPKFYFVALQTLGEEEFLNFIRHHFIEFISNEYIDIFERVRDFLLKIPINFRDDFKKEIREAVLENQEIIGTKEITIPGEKTALKPTVKNWLKEYRKFLGAGYHTALDRRSFLSQSKNANLLDSKEKRYLSDLLMFYELLKISSYQIGALDNWSIENFDPANDINYRTAAENKLISKVPKTKAIKQSAAKPIFKPTSKPRTKIIKAVPVKEIHKTEAPPKIPKTPPKKIEVKPEVSLRPEKPNFPIPPKKKALPPTKPQAPISPEIQELKKLTLKDFKNLGPNVKQNAQTLLNKIRSIAKTHNQRTQARSSFFQSELFKLFKETENQSQTSKKAISQIYQERVKQGLLALTEDEYIAVKSVSKLI